MITTRESELNMSHIEKLRVNKVYLIDKYNLVPTDSLKVEAVRFRMNEKYHCQVHAVNVSCANGQMPIGISHGMRQARSSKHMGLSYRFWFAGTEYGFCICDCEVIK